MTSRPLSWSVTAGVIVASLLASGGIAVWLLWTVADGLSGGLTAPEAAALHLDAVKTGLTVAAGLGAGVTVLLALRRQLFSEQAQRFAEQMAERAQRHAEADAEQRRITELYVQAVEQLGSDKAPVRLGGMYALERLGDNSPALRKTIVEVLCAYLRMPFEMPAGPADEMHVRRTAQQIILRRSHPGERDWGPADLALNSATLVWFDATGCHFGRVDLEHTGFYGKTRFAGATFGSDAFFDDSRCFEEVTFAGAVFHERASFRRTQFDGSVDFGQAKSRSVQAFPEGWEVSQPAVDGWFPVVKTV